MDETSHDDHSNNGDGGQVATSPHGDAPDTTQKSDPDFLARADDDTTKKSRGNKRPEATYGRGDVDAKRTEMAEQLTKAVAEHDQLKARMTELDARRARNDRTIADRRADNTTISEERAQLELLLSAQAAIVAALEHAVPTLAKSKLREGRRLDGAS
jgi:hypothetical protein